MPIALKAVIEVVGGIIPGVEINSVSKSWSYTSDHYEKDILTPPDQLTSFSKMLDEAYVYAKGLSNPAYLNWVKVDWTWM